MKVKLLAGVAMAGLFAAGAASAEPNGWYGALDAGYHTVGEIEAISTTTGPGLTTEVEDSWAGFARLGYRFNENWRVELEGGYRDAGEIESITNSTTGAGAVCFQTPAAGPCLTPDGEVSSTTLMANVIYDFGDASWGLRPFIGLGAGVNFVDTQFLGTLGTARTVGVGADDSSTKLAAQGIAGVAWALGDRAHLDLTYRYLMSNYEFNTFTGSAATAIGPYEGRYDDSHTLTLG
ncbi:MAG: porin family protein, partial [Caulobacteraceae bacterium]